MDTLKRIFQAVTWINEKGGRFISFLVLLMFGLLLLEVFLRYALNSPTVWANEMSQMVFGAYVVLSGGYILAKGGHMNVDILFSRLSRRTQAKLDIFTSVLFFMFCGMMVYFGGSLAWESLSTFEHSQSAWNPPIYPVKLMIPVGAILLLIQGFAKLLEDIRIAFQAEDSLGERPKEKETL